MKIIPNNNADDNKEIAADKRQVKAERKVNSIVIKPGHKVWEFDLSKGELKEAKVEKTEAVLNVVDPLNKKKTKNIRKKILQRPQCLYVVALNRDNALKKVARLYDELIAAGVIIRPQQPDVVNQNKTSLEAWLCLESGRDPELIAIKMFDLLTGHPTMNNPIWELLEATGDAEYEQSTFRKAAEIILSKN